MPIDRLKLRVVRALKSDILYFAIFILFISSEALASSSRVGKTWFQIKQLELSLYRFGTDVHRLPTNEEGLDVLVENKHQISGWSGPYLNKRIPLDHWNNEYRYHYPPEYGNSRFDLYSFGANGIDDHGDKDDVSNWRGYNSDFYPSNYHWSNILFVFLILDLPIAVISYLVWRFFSRRRISVS